MSELSRRLWIEMVSADYEAAVDTQDFDRQDKLWALATQNPDLEAAFLQMHEDWAAMAEEMRPKPLATPEELATIQAAAARFLKAPELTPITGEPTVADVARELFQKMPRGLPADAYALIETMQQSPLPLPDERALSKLIAWAEPLFGPAPRELWKAFHESANTVRMRYAEEQSLAARRAKPKGDA